jgi:lysophospholipase L1-like esterase
MRQPAPRARTPRSTAPTRPHNRLRKPRLLTWLLASTLVASGALGEDFFNLKRYRNANAKVIQSGQPIDVVLMGDSILDAWPRTRPHFFQETGWIGRGISRETTPQMLLRFRQDVIALKPKTVVILAGTNDIAGNTGEISRETTLGYLKSMVELAQANNIRPVLCTVLPAKDYFWSPGKNPDREIPRLNALLSDYAETSGVQLVNLYTIMSDGKGGMREAFSDDGVHPNELGYSAMESRLSRALQSR